MWADAGQRSAEAFVAETSLAGRVGFKSHLHNGQRVATEYTMRPQAAHLLLMQILIRAPIFSAAQASLIHITLPRVQTSFRASFSVR